MKTLSLKSVAEKMKAMDFCMMVTVDGRGSMHARPMSNNREVEYSGDTFFLSFEDTAKVRQIEQHPMVTLIFQNDKMEFVECYGRASVSTSLETIKEHWTDGLERWFTEGPETPGICVIKVTATRIMVWDKEGEGEFRPK